MPKMQEVIPAGSLEQSLQPGVLVAQVVQPISVRDASGHLLLPNLVKKHLAEMMQTYEITRTMAPLDLYAHLLELEDAYATHGNAVDNFARTVHLLHPVKYAADTADFGVHIAKPRVLQVAIPFGTAEGSMLVCQDPNGNALQLKVPAGNPAVIQTSFLPKGVPSVRKRLRCQDCAAPLPLQTAHDVHLLRKTCTCATCHAEVTYEKVRVREGGGGGCYPD
jgi:hypothetical protein